jgi:hypothetical protein
MDETGEEKAPVLEADRRGVAGAPPVLLPRPANRTPSPREEAPSRIVAVICCSSDSLSALTAYE